MIAGNPAFRVYDVDPDTYEIMDARVFIGPASIVTMPKMLTVLIPGDLADPTFQTSRECPSSVHTPNRLLSVTFKLNGNNTTQLVKSMDLPCLMAGLKTSH